MGACRHKRKLVVINFVDEEPVWLYMAFSVPFPVVAKRVISKLRSEVYTVPQLKYECFELSQILASLLCLPYSLSICR